MSYLTESILVENYAWVDKHLEEMYHGYALTFYNYDEYDSVGLLNENWSWVDKKLAKQCINEKNSNSKLSESSENVRKRLRCQSPIPTGNNYLSNPFCNLDCEKYNRILETSIKY